jgi:hypothetical protein
VNLYNIVLFLHLSALIVGFGASSLNHFAAFRLRRARTNGEVREWATLATQLGRVFPLALLTFLATGVFMVSARWAWNAGWVDAGLGGLVALFLGGIFEGSRGSALLRALDSDPAKPVSATIASRVSDPITRAVSYGNTGLAVGIVFIMVNKPALLGAVVLLLVAILIGVIVSRLLWRRVPTGRASTKSEVAL